jgi:hypothetical protein
MHKIIKNLTCHNFFNLKPLHQSEIKKTSDKRYYVNIIRHGSARLNLREILSGIYNQVDTCFLFRRHIMANRKKDKYFLRTKNGWKALLYTVRGYKCRNVNGIFLIDVSRRRTA